MGKALPRCRDGLAKRVPLDRILLTLHDTAYAVERATESLHKITLQRLGGLLRCGKEELVILACAESRLKIAIDGRNPINIDTRATL